MRADPRGINADLHCHSSVSDGTLSPAEVVRRAHANGVELFALTDHDEVDGVGEAAREAARLGMRLVGGVEISVSWAGETIHVLGLNVDASSAGLVEGLERTRSGRRERAREMADQLEAAGIPGAFEGALRHVGNPELVSRTHFARYIVETGRCPDVGSVFDRYLSEGKPGYVPHRWADLDEAVRWILEAGGEAVLAHPGRYHLGESALWVLMDEFRSVGGRAIEVVCGSHRPDQYAVFARHAKEFGFMASRGSDFHAPGEGNADLGRLPALPKSLVPVWAQWQ